MRNPETKIIVFLLLLSPMLGEVLSGSTPPMEFINPVGFIFLALLYGCGTLLIREAKARWRLQWSVLFLAIAYGILEEGTMIQSFLNVSHADLGVLSNYGMYLGIQWPWAIMLILFHATISTLIPIEVAGLLWPEYKNEPILSKGWLIFSFTGLTSVVIVWMFFVVGQKADSAYFDYSVDHLLVIGSALAVGFLIWLAYRYKDDRIIKSRPGLVSPLIFGVCGFIFQAINLLLPNVLAGRQVSGWMTILAQIILATAAWLFVVYQICHQDATKRHIVYLIAGSILFLIVLAPVVEFANGVPGMLALGTASLLLLILWGRTALRN